MLAVASEFWGWFDSSAWIPEHSRQKYESDQKGGSGLPLVLKGLCPLSNAAIASEVVACPRTLPLSNYHFMFFLASTSYIVRPHQPQINHSQTQKNGGKFTVVNSDQ